MAEIKLQRKESGTRKWPWLFLLLIPVIWFAMRGGDDQADAAASDTTAAAAATPAIATDTATPPATKVPASPGDSTRDSTNAKKPPL